MKKYQAPNPQWPVAMALIGLLVFALGFSYQLAQWHSPQATWFWCHVLKTCREE